MTLVTTGAASVVTVICVVVQSYSSLLVCLVQAFDEELQQILQQQALEDARHALRKSRILHSAELDRLAVECQTQLALALQQKEKQEASMSAPLHASSEVTCFCCVATKCPAHMCFLYTGLDESISCALVLHSCWACCQ